MPQVASAQELLQRNKEYTTQHQPALLIQDLLAMPDVPRPKTLVFCCMDARADPFVFLGLKPGEAVVVRNGGGAVASSLDYLVGLDYLMEADGFEDVLVIQHTDCGALTLTNDKIKQHLKEHHRGTDEDIDNFPLDFGIPTIEGRVRANVQLIKDSPFIRQELKDRTRGFVYDIQTGELTELQ